MTRNQLAAQELRLKERQLAEVDAPRAQAQIAQISAETATQNFENIAALMRNGVRWNIDKLSGPQYRAMSDLARSIGYPVNDTEDMRNFLEALNRVAQRLEWFGGSLLNSGGVTSGVKDIATGIEKTSKAVSPIANLLG